MATVTVDKVHAVNDFLHGKGFTLGDCIPYAEDTYVPGGISVTNPTLIAPNGNVMPPSFLNRLLGIRNGRRFFIGQLWTKNVARKADEKRWVLEVYGNQNMESMIVLANSLSKQFNVDIHVILTHGTEQKELFWSDEAAG